MIGDEEYQDGPGNGLKDGYNEGQKVNEVEHQMMHNEG